MKPSSFADVTPEVWSQLKANILQDDGSVMTGDEGTTDIKGVPYSYKYNPETQSLSITELSILPEPTSPSV